MVGAMQAARLQGLDKVEVQRLQVLAPIDRTYKDILADYLNYRGLEVELIDLKKKYEVLTQKNTGASTHSDA